MQFPSSLTQARLIRRYKRFLADVEMPDGNTLTVHCPNPGRMTGCDRTGSEILLSYSDSKTRKLPWTWEMVRVGSTWVGIHTGRTNAIVRHALDHGLIEELRGDEVRAEVRYRDHRIDFELLEGSKRHLVEVKNVTLAEKHIARFPDTVTTRGRSHLETLVTSLSEGYRASVVFLVNREDCTTFSPAEDIDPAFAQAFYRAAEAGVQILVYRAKLTPERITVANRLSVENLPEATQP